MYCYTHKNTDAVGVCSSCGAGVCLSCVGKGFPALCPSCAVLKAEKNIKRIRQSNRIMLYLWLFFGLLFFAVSYLIYANDENILWFLLNAPTLILAVIFFLFFFKNKKKKKAQTALIAEAQNLRTLLIISEPPLTKNTVQEIVSAAVQEILKSKPLKPAEPLTVKSEPKTTVPEPLTAKPEPKTVKTEPKTAAKEKPTAKNNPFAVAEPKTKTEPQTTDKEPLTKSKSAKKVWTCDCGKENMTSKLFCMECGLKRTKEMLQNAKEI